MSNNEKYNSLSRSISKNSQYSDAFETYEDIIKYANTNNNINEIITNKKTLIFDDESSISKHSSIKKNSIIHPEDTNEIDLLTLFKRKTKYIKNTESEYYVINDINNDNYDDINDNLKINEIRNDENDITNTLDEKLYSNLDNSESLKKDDSKKNFLSASKNKNSSKVTKLKQSMNKKNFIFDFNLEPLDTISINTDKNSKNKKEKNKKIKKTFKTLLSLNEKTIKERLSGAIFKKQISYDINTKIISNKKKKRDCFEPNNILRKAVIMNGKKLKNNNLNNDNVDESSIKSNLSINENQLPINKIKFNKIKVDELNTKVLKKFLRKIEVESKREDKSKNFFKTLIELQNFYIDNTSVWIIKLSPDGKYLAGGCKSGKIKIHEIIDYNYSGFKTVYEPNNIIEYLNFISETPFKTLEKHKSDIIDLDWSPFFSNLLLSASLDHLVCLWDISHEKNCLIKEYEHSDMVTSVCFNPLIKNIFMSGCLKHFIHVWKFDLYEGLMLNNDDDQGIISGIYNISYNKSEKKSFKEDKDLNNSFGDMDKTNANLDTINNDDNIDYFNIQHKITSVAFFPDSSKIAVGVEKGKIFVYKTFPKISYIQNFFVAKKNFGIFHGGKKVTNIQFLDKNYAIVTTADSTIRYVNMNKGQIIRQYKGYSNEFSMTRAYADLTDDVIIIGGEDGKCYVWKIYEQISEGKNKKYECFKPFAKETVECSIIAHERCYINYMQKILKLTNKILILNIIINGTSKGRLEILLNIKEE